MEAILGWRTPITPLLHLPAVTAEGNGAPPK